MGFALWIDSDVAWCAGTHEYKPMGVAVIATSSLFYSRDFDAFRQAPGERSGRLFRGLFASLPDVNSYMVQQRSKPDHRQNRPGLRRQLATVHKSQK